MIEPKFEVKISIDEYKVLSLNKEAGKLMNDVDTEFGKGQMLRYILLSPNSMDMNSDGDLIYEVDNSMTEEVLSEMRRKINYK